MWVSIDENTGQAGRKVGDVVIGVLKNDKIVSEFSFLIACKEISTANHNTFARMFNDSMHLF